MTLDTVVTGNRTQSVGASPASLYVYVEKVDKVVEKAPKLGATSQGPVMDMFWGDRCGTIVDPDGYTWIVGTPQGRTNRKGLSDHPHDRRSELLCLAIGTSSAQAYFAEECSTSRVDLRPQTPLPGSASFAVFQLFSYQLTSTEAYNVRLY